MSNDCKEIADAIYEISGYIERDKRYLAEYEATIKPENFDSFSSFLLAKADRDCLREHLANLVSKKMELEIKLLESLIRWAEEINK